MAEMSYVEAAAARRITEAQEIADVLVGGSIPGEAAGLFLLGLVALHPDQPWSSARQQSRTGREIADFLEKFYRPLDGQDYRRAADSFTGLGVVESDPFSSAGEAFRITERALQLVRSFGTPTWERESEAAFFSAVEAARPQTKSSAAKSEAHEVSSEVRIASWEIAEPETKSTAPADEAPEVTPELETAIRRLVDGSEEERLETLQTIRQISDRKERSRLAKRLIYEIETRFKPGGNSTYERSIRNPQGHGTIRSWMLSCLIWADAEESESRACILRHLESEFEPERHVRFWTLAGIWQRQVAYVSEAAVRCSGDEQPEVRTLAKTILHRSDPGLLEGLRDRLRSNEFADAWPALRALRIVPVTEVAPDVCELLLRRSEDGPLGYDAIYALASPPMATVAAKILPEKMPLPALVHLLLRILRDSNENAAMNFAVFLEPFDRTAVDEALAAAIRQPATRDRAEALSKYLAEYRRRVAKPDGAKNGAGYVPMFSAYTPDRAAYGPRAGHGSLDDALAVGVHAGHLAQLIAARETPMPLSIGLFGSWGAGKSHFMDLLEERIAALSRRPGKVFHEHIIQIRFNAWHYLDTNLWANLVCEIFDQLFRRLDGPGQETQVENLKSELARQSALAAEAREALSVAEQARSKAEDELNERIKERVKEQQTVAGLIDNLGAITEEIPEVRQALKDAAEGLGLPRLATSYAELEASAVEVRSLGGRIRALCLGAFTGSGWWARSLLLIAALALPLFIGWAAQHAGWAQQLFAGAAKTVGQIVSAVTLLAAWLKTQASAGSKLVEKLEDAYAKVKSARETRLATDAKTVERQKALAQKQQAEETARHTVQEAEQRIKAISAELAEMAPGRQLIRFLKERASAEDYRRHLGLVSLIRRDFERLSELLLAPPAELDLPRLQRIVLYIDDLDRCRAERVIEVLEAVHLLLAFPLFAVVVAVDPRWLRQSLLDHYPRLLAGGRGDGKAQLQLRGRATPQDYLEKIFQVPFNLQPLEKRGFEALIRQLFPVRPAGALADGKRVPHQNSQQEPNASGEVSPAPKPVEPQSSDATPAAREGAGTGAGEAGKRPAPEAPAPRPEPTPPDPERLVLLEKELTDLGRFQPLFETPRAVKRFANTYCLIRVGVEESAWGEYLGPGERRGAYAVPMTLLAVTSAFPSIARSWLRWVAEKAPDQWNLTEKDLNEIAGHDPETAKSPEWLRLRRQLDKVDLQTWPGPSVEALRAWVPRVARYSF